MRKVVMSVGLVGVLLGAGTPAKAAPGEKSPLAAGLLGGLLGLGSGYYYAGNTTKGVVFTVADLGLRSGYFMGIADENEGLVLGTGLGMLASAFYQGFDGAAEAKNQNRKRGFGLLDAAAPIGFEFGPATMPGWDSGLESALWANGGADRDRALAASLMRQSRPPLSLSVGIGQDTSVGLGWSTSF